MCFAKTANDYFYNEMNCVFFAVLIIIVVSMVFCDLRLTKFEECDKKNTKTNFTSKLWMEGHIQYMSFSIDLPHPLDDNVLVMGTLYRISSAKKLQQLTKVSGKFCKIFKTYAGKIGEEVQRSVKMQPGCPIPKGSYKANRIKLDFMGMGVYTFLPLGKFLLTHKYVATDTHQEIICFNTESEIN